MGIFDRFNRVIKSNLNSLVDRAEDPTKLLDQTVTDMEAELKNVRKDLVTQLATSKRLEKDAEDKEADVRGWEDKAVLALKAGDEELAREALKMKQKAKAKADAALKQADAAAAGTRQLQSTLEQLEQKIEDLKARKTALAASARTANVRSAGVKELDERIDRLNARGEVDTLLDEGEAERARLEAKFRDLERKQGSSQVDDELAALKRRLEG